MINYKDRYNRKFVEWVDSINSGFQNKIDYQPFTDYVNRAEEYLENTDKPSDFIFNSDKVRFVGNDIAKFKENSLYCQNKLLYVKDIKSPGGMKKFKATPAQQIFLFMMDMLYNMLIGKGRQIGFTTAFGGVAAQRISFVDGYFIKFITHTDTKGEEIFEDKIKFAFQNIPVDYRVGVYNYSGETITTLYGSQTKNKIDKGAFNGKIMKVAPADDAVSGGTPNLVAIDEVGMVKNYGAIIRNGRPTMFGYDDILKELVMKQQLVSWGTAALKGGKSSIFKEYMNTAKDEWEKKNYGYGVVPLFFNAFARQGMTMEFWLQEKAAAEATPEQDREKAIIEFYQAYPMDWEDMFMSASKTIIPFGLITENIQRIRIQERKATYGYFDVANGNIQDYIDRKITNVMPVPIFKSTRGLSDPKTTSVMYEQPEADWLWRYYKGTDTISTRNGHSKFSSSIWDEHKKTIQCCVNFRSQNFKECFMQSVLQALYYSNKHYLVKDLVELNNGDGYIEFVENLGLKNMLIQNSMLPNRLQTPESLYGIRKGNNTSGKINDNLLDLLENFSENINIEDIFLQLKTFVAKEKETGYITFKPESRFDFDDLLDGVTYGYMGAQCYSRHAPTFLGAEVQKKPVIKWVQNKDTNFQIRRARVYPDGRVEYLS